MTYNSVLYLAIFFPLTIILYSIIPKKHRSKILLIASYIFFWSISNKLILYIVFSTMSIHHLGLWLNSLQMERDNILKEVEKDKKKEIKKKYLKKQRKVIALGIIVHLGILLVVKYSAFILGNVNLLFNSLKLSFNFSIPNFVMPIGISFYTLQAISYIIDVYHEKIKADKNIGRLALYLAFFPNIMEGPICRYSEIAKQLWEGNKITYHNLKYGILRISYGLMKKMIIADRLNIFVKEVFTNYAIYDGGVIAVGMVLYTLQLYMDFSGIMDMAVGTGEIFGIKVPENFRQPFFSKSISEFWTRWHITLGTFFKEYIFYPLSLSEPLKKITTKARKRLGKHYGPLLASTIALFCVWFANGLWHGAAWTFIFFGMYHFGLILSGKFFEPQLNWITNKLHINRENCFFRTYQIIRTTLLVFIGELFFRANTLKAGFEMFTKMITNFTFNSIINSKIFKLGMVKKDFLIVAIFTIVVFIISILHERNISVRDKVSKKNIIVRWIIYYTIIIVIVVFGAYGIGYQPVDPMYANF